MPTNPLTRLRHFIANHYGLADFRLLCGDLAVLYDDLGGEERISIKADRLLYLVGQQRRYVELLAVLHRTRKEAFEQGGLGELTPEALLDALPVYAGEQVEGGRPKRGSVAARTAGRYERQEELGRGSFAVVYKALDTALNRPVALKVLHPYWQEAPQFVERFKLEAQTAARLSHPHIIQMYDFGQDGDGRLFLAMKYLPGRTLEEYLAQHGPLALATALPILEQIAAALDYAHSQGVVHRDLKPGNIMIEETAAGPTATLTDFGLVKAMEGSVALTMHAAALVGSPEYMAPEQADPNRHAEVGPAADRYTLGVLAYQMLTGRVPFPGNSTATLYAHEYIPPPVPRQIQPDLPEGAEYTLLKMLAKTTHERFASCAAFVVALIEDGPGDVWLNPQTGKEMVRVPAGPFLFGKKKEKRELPEFWIDKTPVTNVEYARFVAETRREPPGHWQGKKEPPPELADHPVVYVAWENANAYAGWAGCRLPSEEEWEKAARGTDGRQYPWGDEWKNNRCNTKEAGIGKTTPVGHFSPASDSPYGCVDMSGNVFEWTSEKYIVKGGSWRFDKTLAHAAARYDAHWDDWLDNFGFRVVVAAPSSSL